MAETDPDKTPEAKDKETGKEAGKAADKPAESPSAAKSPPTKGIRGWLLLIAVVAAAGLLIFAGGKHLKDLGQVGDKLVEATKSAGSPTIGGPFTLTDMNGRTVTDKTYAGEYMLVYFGYTYCPDVCPTGLTEMSNTLDALGDLADRIQPIFISVDPDRDTPEQLKEYTSYFHPRLIGLTGTHEQVAAAAKAYRVYFAKVESKDADADPEDYTVDHSAVTYLMDPKGVFVQHFSHGTSAENMAKRIREILNP